MTEKCQHRYRLKTRYINDQTMSELKPVSAYICTKCGHVREKVNTPTKGYFKGGLFIP